MKKEVEFIKNNINIDISQLILSKNKYKNLNIDFCIEQINSRQKIKYKLPFWYNNYCIILPPSLNLEQSSSQKTAEIKAKLFSGNIALDLTGGFGIDSYYLSQSFKKVIHIEPNKLLHEIAKYNYKVLNISNIECFNSTAEEYIKNFENDYDLIYLDPSRRNENKKTFLLEDTLPNPIDIIPKIINHTKNILIKISPLFDIKQIENKINNINNISVISIKNECKEILITVNKGCKLNNYIGYNYNGKKWDILEYCKNEIEIEYGLPNKYIYEPNSSLQKLQCYGAIYKKYKIKKLHHNSHLFTSDELINFQGRVFEVIGIEKLNIKSIRKYLPENKANITVRNYPSTSEKIKLKLKINDGGNIYLFATTDINNKKIILICNKIIQEQGIQL